MADSFPNSSLDGFESVRDEDAKVFESFVEQYYQPAYRFAFSLCGNHHDAGDITQQAFYLAHTKSHQLRDASKRKQWLFTILHREFLRCHRRIVAHPQTTLEFSEPMLPHISVDHAMALDGKALLLVLKTLEENFRIPLVLFYLDQLSYREIATALDVPIGTVMSRLARGKQMLRQRLEQERVAGVGKIIDLRKTSMGGRSDG
jgi:RNA polymerase sigma-70 factor (ECF subfamily)